MAQSNVQQAIVRQKPQPFTIYLWLVSAIGLTLIALAIAQVWTFQPLINFALFTLFVIITQSVSETLPVSGKAGVTYSVSSAVSMAAVPFFGAYATVLLDAIGVAFVWIYKPFDDTTWKKNLSQLCFNLGMASISSYLAAQAYLQLEAFFQPTNELAILPFLMVAAFVYDQSNMWIVIGILRLQHGKSFDGLEMWRSNRWATVIHITNVVIGGGVLIFAVNYFDWIGIVVFFVPILLSAYAFYIYISQTKVQMTKMEEIIAERTRDLQRVNEEKDTFLALLTHDMKSPLTSIGMYAEMMRRKPDLIQQKPHTIENILRAHTTLNDLVNNIVDLEKLQNDGALPLEYTLFDVTDLVEYVVEVLQPQAVQKKIMLSSELAHREIRLKADRLQIERVLTNLVSNAIKYTSDAGTVHVRVHQFADSVCIVVQDNGFGIPADELPYIFDRYRRVDKHRNIAVGTGLGLAIAKAIAEGHGGTLVAESAENVGSTFTLTLPLQAV